MGDASTIIICSIVVEYVSTLFEIMSIIVQLIKMQVLCEYKIGDSSSMCQFHALK